jgi:hypothetical protein
MPSKVNFYFSAMINPEGPTDKKNFLIDTSEITVKNVEARIPLDFSVKGMVLKDTLDFNASKVTFKDMELFMNIENNMPVKVGLQAYLMDEKNEYLDDENGHITLFKDPVSIPVGSYEEKIGANVKNLEKTKKLEVEITVNTEGSEENFVQIKSSNYIHLQIGAKATININEID